MPASSTIELNSLTHQSQDAFCALWAMHKGIRPQPLFEVSICKSHDSGQRLGQNESISPPRQGSALSLFWLDGSVSSSFAGLVSCPIVHCPRWFLHRIVQSHFLHPLQWLLSPPVPAPLCLASCQAWEMRGLLVNSILAYNSVYGFQYLPRIKQ